MRPFVLSHAKGVGMMNRIAWLALLPLVVVCFFVFGQWMSRASSSRIGSAEDTTYRYKMGHYDPEAPCGPVSASLSARLIGVDLDLNESKALVASDQKGRTTALQLIDGLKKAGLAARAFRFSSVPRLAADTPMIVHMSGDHWAVVAANDHAQLLLDPPNDPSYFVDRIQFWDGFAIAVSRDEESIEFLSNEADR